MLWNPTNADASPQPQGSVVRSGASPNEVLLALADTSENAANIVGSRIAEVAAGAAGLVQPIATGTRIRMAAEPNVNDQVYLSDTVAGQGVTTAPALAVLLGTCYEKALVGGVWYAEIVASAESQTSGAVASWPVDQVRHYLVHKTLGDDANVGYVDAAVDAASIVTTGKPLKTIARLLEILPRTGNGRMVVIHLANDSFELGTSYAEALDLSGFGGYAYILKRAWTAWDGGIACWSQRDRDLAGARIAIAGPNPDGSWTVDTTDITKALKLTVSAGGAALADDAAAVFRVRFSGNVTASLTDATTSVYSSYTDTVETSLWYLDTPAAGDTFWIERPGVQVAEYYEATGLTGVTKAADHSSPGRVSNYTVGLDFGGAAKYTNRLGSIADRVRYVFCEISSDVTDTLDMRQKGSYIEFESAYQCPDGVSYGTPGASFRLAGSAAIRYAKYVSWDYTFGSVKLPGAEVNHGSFSVQGDIITGYSGVFLGGLSLIGAQVELGLNDLDESMLRMLRVVRVLELQANAYNGIMVNYLSGIHFDDAILKLGDSTPARADLLVSLANLTGGPTVNATCGATGKKCGVFCRNTSAAIVIVGRSDFGAIPTLTGIDGDILLMPDSWARTLAYADLSKSDFTDQTGTRWIGPADVVSAGNPLTGTALTDADATIAPGTDKCSLYVLPPVLTANHQVTVDPTNMLSQQSVTIRIRDLSIYPYLIVNGGPAAGTLFTKPVSPGAVIDVRVRLNAAGTDVELVEAAYKDT